jgi:hypothetical protein
LYEDNIAGDHSREVAVDLRQSSTLSGLAASRIEACSERRVARISGHNSTSNLQKMHNRANCQRTPTKSSDDETFCENLQLFPNLCVEQSLHWGELSEIGEGQWNYLAPNGILLTE